MPDVPGLAAQHDDLAARFLLDGHECVVQPLTAAVQPGWSRLGTLDLLGRRYAIDGLLHAPAGPDPVERLTPRELEIALLIAAGCCNKTVGRRLGISAHTVGAHLGRIYAKLDLHKRTELTVCVVHRLIEHRGSAKPWNMVASSLGALR
jgi:DNA-binding CsgD family transcriptional regulator